MTFWWRFRRFCVPELWRISGGHPSPAASPSHPFCPVLAPVHPRPRGFPAARPAGGEPGGASSLHTAQLSPSPGPQPRQFVAVLVAGPPRHGARAPPGPWDTASPPQRPPLPRGPGAAPAASASPPGQHPKWPLGPAPLGCGAQPTPQLDFPHLNQKQRGGATAPPLRGPVLCLWCCCFLFALAFTFVLSPSTPAPFPHFVSVITINTKVLRLKRDYKNINE